MQQKSGGKDFSLPPLPQPLFIVRKMLYSAVVFAFAAVALGICQRGRIEFADRKRHILEQTARIVIFVLYAFFIGNAILGDIDEILCGAFDTDN